MNSMWKRSFALLLSLVMVFGMVPVNAFAEGTECSHSYEATVTDPTCTAVGYTTYTCACGDTYTADEVAATGHSYADGVCSVCGAEEPAVEEQNEEEDDEIVEEETEEDEIVEEEPVDCDGTENCAAETHETTCERYDPCVALGCTDDAHAEGCPYTIPCDLNEGCKKHKGHYGECEGMIVYVEPVAYIGETPYATLKEAFQNVAEGQTITLLPGTIAEDSVTLPANLKNVTVQGAVGKTSVLKDLTINSFSGSSLHYEGLKFDGIVFDNSNIVFTGQRTGEVIYKNLTITNCEFKNIVRSSNYAAFHFNSSVTQPINGFTFTNNIIDGVTGSSNCGLNLNGVTGNINVSNNVVHNVAFYPFNTQIVTNDGIADTFTVANNTFSGSSIGCAQALGKPPVGKDSVTLTVNNNIFKDITGTYQFCFYNFDSEKTSADLSKNYYDVDIAKNPGKIYYNSEAASTGDLKTMGVFPYYTGLDESGAIDPETLTFPTYGSVTYGYTSANSIWGECSGNAKESLVIKFYSGETFMGSTTLNNIDGIIDGDVFVTWNMLLDAQSNQDAYWTMVWEKAPSAQLQPDRLELWIDGAKVAENVIRLNAPDNTESLVAAVADKEGKLVSYAKTLTAAMEAAKDGGIIKLLADVTESVTINKPITLNGNGKKLTGDVVVKANTTFKGDFAVSGNVKAGYEDHSVSNMEVIVDGNLSAGYFYLGNKSEHYPNGGEHKLTINSGAVLDAGTLNVRTTGVVVATDAEIKTGDLMVRGNMTVNGGSLTRPSSSGTGHWTIYEDDDATKTATLTLNNVTTSNTNYIAVGRNANNTAAADSNAKLVINGGSLTLNNLYVHGEENTFKNNELAITDASITIQNAFVSKFAAMNVYGESTLNITSLADTDDANSVDFQDGAVIKNSNIGGTVYIAGNVTFRGNNTFEMITDYGDYYSKETPSKWTVEQGGTLTLTKTDRYGLGYGDQVTVDGATVTMDGGLVGMTSSAAPNAVSTFTAQNSTLSFGVKGDKSFGNKSGNYYGNYEFNFSKSTVTANAFKFYEDQGKTTLVSTDTNWNVNGVFMTNDSNSKFTFTNATIVSRAASNGSDDKNQNAGELTLDKTALTYNAAFTNVGTVVLKNGSKLSAPSLVNNGTITVDASGYQTGDVVIELTNATPSAEMVTVTGAEGATVKVEDNKLVVAVPVAKVGDDYYTTLKDALDNAAPGATVTLMKNITVSENWDCRYTGTKLTKAITIDGAGHTMTFTGTVDDKNHFSVFRFEAPATVKNLNIDMSQCTNTDNMRAISTKADLVVENCDFTGNTTSNSRAIIFGEGSGATIGEVDVKITGSTFTNWKRGLTDNENGQDVKSVEVTGNTFTNAAVYISAKKDLTFTGNTVSGAKVSITTYSKPAELSATATGNTLDAAQTNTIKAAVINAQPEFAAAVVAKIGSKTYGTLQAAVNAVQNGETIVVQTDITGAENVVVPNGVTFTLDLNDKTFNGTIKVPNADLTVKNGKIVNTNSSVNAVESTGTLTVTNVDITSARAAVRVEGGKATLTGGTYRTNNAGGMTVNTINVSGNSKVTVENVTVYGPKGTGADAGAAVASRDTAAVTIKSGNFSGGVLNTLSGASKNNIVVTGGTYDQNPGEFCEDRYAPAYDSAKGTWTVVEAAASVTGADNVRAYYPTVADAVKATDNGETLTIIADRKDPTKDTSVTKTAAMNIAANAQGGVTVTANVPANSKYVQIPVKGVTYRVGAYGDLTISKNGVVGGDNVPIKDGKPDYTLKPLNSEASYLSGSNATLTFESNMIFATFTKAYIDGTEIVLDKDYVATPGSTVITLANARLRTLTAGKHTLMIKDDSNNTVPCDFHVTVNASADTTNPKTGDEIALPMFVMFSTAAALAVLVMGKKKHF